MDEDDARAFAPARLDGSQPDRGGPSGRRGWASRLGSLLGLGLVAAWVGLFVASARQDELAFGRSTWVPALTFMGGDFKWNIDHIVRVRALGYKPHQVLGDFYCATHPYPPMISRYFGWVMLFDKMTASVIWQGLLGLFAAVGGVAAWKTRKGLGLGPIPLPLVIAVALFNTPFLFALERGQCDPLIIPPLAAAAWLLGRKGTWAELGAGAILGLTAWVKYYPGLAVIVLVTLGHRKALASFAAVVALVGIVDLEGIRESIKAGLLIQNDVLGRTGSMYVWGHALIDEWRLYGFVRHSPLLRRVPTLLLAAILLLPALALVARRVARAKDPRALAFPYMLWLISAGTFALPYSNDYNLATLPLAILAVWDRRDRAIVHLALASSFLWIQPIWLPIDGGVLFYFKLGAIYAVGACLVAQSAKGSRPGAEGGRAVAPRPAFARLKRPLGVATNSERPGTITDARL